MNRQEAREAMRQAGEGLNTVWVAIYQGGWTEAEGYTSEPAVLKVARDRFDSAAKAWAEATE